MTYETGGKQSKKLKTDNTKANMHSYEEFLLTKQAKIPSCGLEPGELSSSLFPFQRDITRWALRKGRAAIFADTGLGKTAMQCEWAHRVHVQTGGNVLIVAPLSVARQTVREARAILGVDIVYARSHVDAPIVITNYEMLDHFDADKLAGVVLDESSILKSIAGKTRTKLIEKFADTQYRLACTATPAPNDISEIANHCEFLGIMSRVEMLASFFVHDDEGWRLKGHAVNKFYKWMAAWSMSIRKPSDLGYSDEGYDLPGLNIEPVWVHSEYRPQDTLFFTKLKGIGDRSDVRRQTLPEKVKAAAEIINASDEQWIVWCGLNDESRQMAAACSGAVEVEGGDSPEKKEAALQSFQDGNIRVLVTKPKIAGFGMNFQNAHKMMFVGLSDSWEAYYQCIRRCYRFGQKSIVDVMICLSDYEHDIFTNVMNKEAEASKMSQHLIEHIQQYEMSEIGGVTNNEFEYSENDVIGDGYKLMLGDSTVRMREIKDDSIDLSVFSPPFVSLYTYSPTERDLGNSRTDDEFYTHFGFICEELLRITKPGRICAVHVADVPAMLARDGYIGLKDFSGDVIRLFISKGWVFDSRVPIDKNQQAQSIRTHAKGLTMTQMEKDRTWSRPALPDYILKFRKPGENQVPVRLGEITRDLWIEYANPTWPGSDDRCMDSGAHATWYGIQESDTLQGWMNARDEQDERHICPLQIGTIERVIKLWSNAGELVFTPFMGIGSEVHTAVRLGRRGMGIELKPSYFQQAVKNMHSLNEKSKQSDLFS